MKGNFPWVKSGSNIQTKLGSRLTFLCSLVSLQSLRLLPLNNGKTRLFVCSSAAPTLTPPAVE